MGRIRLWIIRLLLRDDLDKLEQEIEEEFRFHVDMKAAALAARGVDPEAARKSARESFGDSAALRRAGLGNLSAARRVERRRNGRDWLNRDLRDGLRHLARHPAYSLLVVGTLALGLAASTAVFTYVNAYHRPFPGADTDGVFQVFRNAQGATWAPLSYPDYLDLAATASDRFEVTGVGRSLFGASVRHETLTEVVFGQSVTGNFFTVMRIGMSAGRGLSPDDDRPGAAAAVVLSHEYWVRRYGADPGVLGDAILLNNEPYTIVGVAGPSFVGSMSTFRPQIWLPFEQYKRVYWARSDTETNREAGVVSPYIRALPGTDDAEIEGSLAALATTLDTDYPLSRGSRRFVTEPATWIPPQVRQDESRMTRIMLIAAAALLLLACANVANLVLSAGARRHRELAMRSAMGASRARLARQLLAETLMLSVLAGGLALAAAGPAANRLSSWFARPSVWGVNVPRVIDVDLRVLAFAFLAAVAVGMLTGVLPAIRTSSRDPASILKDDSGTSGGDAGKSRWMPGTRDVLVSAQVALSIVLLFLAGLVLRTLESARAVDPGFDTDRTLASYISTSSMGVPAPEREAFFRDLARRFEDMPWVSAATVAEQAPLSSHPEGEVQGEGSGAPVRATIARVVPGYFEAVEMPILQGRSFLPTDTADAQGVAVVNETLARRLAGEGNIVGSTLRLPGDGDAPERRFEIVGVVRNAHETSLLDEPEPVVYFSFPQHYYAPGNAFILKVTDNPFTAVRRMEEELHAVDPRIAIVNILPYSEVVSGFLYTQRMNAELFTLIAALGLLLSTAGVFGVVSLAVAQRRKEIGIRIAIGADPGAIVRVVVSRVSLSLAFGLAAGLAGVFLARSIVQGLVWGISPDDPTALVGGVVVLLGAIVLAVGIPIRRALTIDPLASLRVE